MTPRVGECADAIKEGREPRQGAKMKIDCKDFRVREGDKVHLEKWPTKVDAV
jgi:hypothetical protein